LVHDASHPQSHDRYQPQGRGGLGGANKIVEANESFVGGKASNRPKRDPAPKKTVLSLVERADKVTNARRASRPMTDESLVYTTLGGELSGHYTPVMPPDRKKFFSRVDVEQDEPEIGGYLGNAGLIEEGTWRR
jgi:hypothetical protein